MLIHEGLILVSDYTCPASAHRMSSSRTATSLATNIEIRANICPKLRTVLVARVVTMRSVAEKSRLCLMIDIHRGSLIVRVNMMSVRSAISVSR